MNEGDDDLATLAEIARAKLNWQGSLARNMPLVESLALDSLKRLTLVVEIEDRFRICLDEGDEAAIETVGDLLDTIRRKRAEPGAHAR
jgi:acyl carrier protein